MSPQPKWRVSAERLAAIIGPHDLISPLDIVRDLAADNIDARVEIDTLQAAVRDLRAAVSHPKGSEPHYSCKTCDLLARMDKLLPEDE